MDVTYIFYEKLDSTFKFQLTWDIKKLHGFCKMRARNGIFKVYLYSDWSSWSCSNFHFIFTYMIYELQLCLWDLSWYLLLLELYTWNGGKKLSQKPHQNPAHLSSKLHSTEDILKRPNFKVEKFFRTPELLKISTAESLEIITHSVKSNTFKIQVLIS